MIRLGLCCLFKEAPIKFRTTRAIYLKKIEDPLGYVSEIILSNISALKESILYCSNHGIGSFRINSEFCPCYTHPEVGYALEELPDAPKIKKGLKECKNRAQENNIRLTFHPDQFVVLSTPHEHVLTSSIAEIEYHATLAELIGADVINIHGGGVYGDKEEALYRFGVAFEALSSGAQSRLTIENDEKSYTPSDLIPVCRSLNIPLVYDVHHHRCNPDGLSIERATQEALATWGKREPLFHISSPKEGWHGQHPERHHDLIDPTDFPNCWNKITPLTVDVEAKAKEVAVERLRRYLSNN